MKNINEQNWHTTYFKISTNTGEKPLFSTYLRICRIYILLYFKNHDFLIQLVYFFDLVSEAGAKTNAICLSIVETAKSNGVDFYEYLKKILTDLPILGIHQDQSPKRAVNHQWFTTLFQIIFFLNQQLYPFLSYPLCSSCPWKVSPQNVEVNLY